jgi:hypothetical protein
MALDIIMAFKVENGQFITILNRRTMYLLNNWGNPAQAPVSGAFSPRNIEKIPYDVLILSQFSTPVKERFSSRADGLRRHGWPDALRPLDRQASRTCDAERRALPSRAVRGNE